VDPASAARLHSNDAVRVIRAMEVFLVSGRPISALQEEDRAQRRPRPARRFGLTLPRPELYTRIDRRVEKMIESGLKAEVVGLLSQGYSPNLSPMRSLGYKEMIAHVQGEWDLDTAIRSIQQNTRRYAKRQQTWFHADPAIDWINVSALSSAEVANQIQQQVLVRS
jgi:tRNA dimethylallyltransferase